MQALDKLKVIDDDPKYKLDPVMLKNLILLSATRYTNTFLCWYFHVYCFFSGSDIMITDHMKGHRYGVINPSLDISQKEAIEALKHFKLPFMRWLGTILKSFILSCQRLKRHHHAFDHL